MSQNSVPLWNDRIKRPLPLAFFFGVLFLATAIAYYNVSRVRSITVEASTAAISIKFAGKSVWRFENALVCKRNSQKRSRAMRQSSSALRENILKGEQCGEREDALVGATTLSFKADQHVQVISNALGTQQITVKNVGASKLVSATVGGVAVSLSELTRIVVRSTSGINDAVMPFDGEISIGSEIRAGTRSILNSGKFEMLEVLPGREKPTKVFSGELIRGDVIEFTDRSGVQKNSIGFLTTIASDSDSFRIVATYQAKDAKLELFRTGFQPALIQPRWSDRALADPVTIAVASLLGLFAVMVTFLNELRILISSKQDD